MFLGPVNVLGPVNAVKQTVRPDRNKRMQQPTALSWFLATFFFFVIGKVPFFYLMLNDRLPLHKRLL